MDKKRALGLIVALEWVAFAQIVGYVWWIAANVDRPSWRTLVALTCVWMASWAMIRLDDRRNRLKEAR